MDIDRILTLAFYCLPIIFALVCLYYSLYYLKIARTLEDIPSSKIRSAAQGYVELLGTTKSLSSQPIIGKITRKPCAWYRYTIEQFRTLSSTSSNNATWRVLESGISMDPLLLEDGTGECIILPRGAEIISAQVIRWRGHSRIPHPPPTSFFKWLFWNSWGSYRYSEYRIELGIPLYAHGMFITLKSEDPYLQAIPLIQSYLYEKNPSSIHLLTKEGLPKNENFIISTLLEKRLTRQFRLKALLFFIVFVIFAGIAFHSTYIPLKKAIRQSAQ